MDTAERADQALDRLRARYGKRYAHVRHESPFRILVAAILATQETDRTLAGVTPALFEAYPTAEAMTRADLGRLRAILAPLRHPWTKAAWLKELAREILERHGGELPRDLAALTALPGVGPRTASAVQGCVWGHAETVAADAHVARVAYRLAFASAPDDAELAAEELVSTFVPGDWPDVGYYFGRHGRLTCVERRPRCGECAIEALCPKVGVTTISEGVRGLAHTRDASARREGQSPRRP